MHCLCKNLAISLCLAIGAFSAASGPGYFTATSTLPHNDTFSFGTHYAVLNLDLINLLVSSVANYSSGTEFIACTAKWIDTVHAQKPPPLSIFTRIYFANSHYPDIAPGSAFAMELGINGSSGDSGSGASQSALTETNPLTQIWPAFKVLEDYDVVLEKTRYYAGFGNNLENILGSQKIDTVVIVSPASRCRCHRMILTHRRTVRDS